MSAPTTPLPARRLSKQLNAARALADRLCTAVDGVQRVTVATHHDGTVTVSLRIATAPPP